MRKDFSLKDFRFGSPPLSRRGRILSLVEGGGGVGGGAPPLCAYGSDLVISKGFLGRSFQVDDASQHSATMPGRSLVYR